MGMPNVVPVQSAVCEFSLYSHLHATLVLLLHYTVPSCLAAHVVV